MGRRKKVPLNFWECNSDGVSEKSYCRLGQSLFLSWQFAELPVMAKIIYVEMVSAAAGKRDFTFSVAEYSRRGLSKNGVLSNIPKLVQAGFIEVLESGWTQRKPNKYRFSQDWRTRKKVGAAQSQRQ